MDKDLMALIKSIAAYTYSEKGPSYVTEVLEEEFSRESEPDSELKIDDGLLEVHFYVRPGDVGIRIIDGIDSYEYIAKMEGPHESKK